MQSASLTRRSSLFIYAQMWGPRVYQPPPRRVHQLPPCSESSPLQLPGSTPPTSLDEYFFFISLVVGLPCSSVSCQFWLFFVFKLLLSFFWLCEEAQCVYLYLHLGRKSLIIIALECAEIKQYVLSNYVHFQICFGYSRSFVFLNKFWN